MAIKTHLPISTTHSVVGCVFGVAIVWALSPDGGSFIDSDDDDDENEKRVVDTLSRIERIKVLVEEPEITLLVPVVSILPVAVKSSKVTSPLKSTVAPITLPNEPVLVADPLIVPAELIVRFEPLKVRLPVIAGL